MIYPSHHIADAHYKLYKYMNQKVTHFSYSQLVLCYGKDMWQGPLQKTNYMNHIPITFFMHIINNMNKIVTLLWNGKSI